MRKEGWIAYGKGLTGGGQMRQRAGEAGTLPQGHPQTESSRRGCYGRCRAIVDGGSGEKTNVSVGLLLLAGGQCPPQMAGASFGKVEK